LEAQDILVALVLDMDHLAEELDLIITGHHGSELVELVVKVCMELQVAVAVAVELAEEDQLVEALEDLKQLITLEELAVMVQVLAVEEIIIQVEMVKREVLA
jgi:hypothetical protein